MEFIMFLNVELYWWAIFLLGMLGLTAFIWYFSRGTEWLEPLDKENPDTKAWFFDRFGTL